MSYGISITYVDNVVTLNGTTSSAWINFSPLDEKLNVVGKFYIKMTILKNDDGLSFYYSWLNRNIRTNDISSGSTSSIFSQTSSDLEKGMSTGILWAKNTGSATFNDVKIQITIINLTKMFGEGNEPTTTEEFESMFPNSHYPYNEGELMSMSVNNVVYTDTSSNQTSHPIPQAIQNLDGYGWGVGNVYNYVDYENKKYYKRVGKYVVTGSEYFLSSENSGYIGNNSSNAYFVKNIGNKPSAYDNSISNKLKRVALCWSIDSAYNAMDFNEDQLHIRILNSELGTTSEASQSEVESAVKKYCKDLYDSGDPIIIYYELAEPIVTDISDIIGDTFQEPIDIESGDSLTFKNSNGDGYQVAVPSDVQYTIKLSEVAP